MPCLKILLLSIEKALKEKLGIIGNTLFLDSAILQIDFKNENRKMDTP